MGDNDIRNVDDDQQAAPGRAVLAPAELSRDEMIILTAMTSILTLLLTLIITMITLTRLITLPTMVLTTHVTTRHTNSCILHRSLSTDNHLREAQM